MVMRSGEFDLWVKMATAAAMLPSTLRPPEQPEEKSKEESFDV
jgi:hypothetical protein